MALVWCLLLACAGTAAGVRGPAASASRQAQSMLQTRSAEQARGGAKGTPYARVVDLLTAMSKTLTKEMEEDKLLYEKLKCWCEDNSGEKDKAIEDSKSMVEELEADIESLAAKKTELETTIAKVKAKTDDGKTSLAKAQAVRDEQLKEFHAMDLDSVQAVENLKAAIVVLGKHHDEGAFQQFSSVSFLELRRRQEAEEDAEESSEDDEEDTWTQAHEARAVSQPLDDFMLRSGMSGSYGDAEEVVEKAQGGKLLQQNADSLTRSLLEPAGWSAQDAATIRRAVKTAGAFLQARHEESYFPSYAAQSGEILGVLKQIKDEVEAQTKEAQELEKGRAEGFEKLRQAKSAEIEAGEKMEEQKEDELAATANALAEAKEDLGQEKAVLEENESFMKSMKETCSKADANFAKRTALRQAEMGAVTETVQILTEEEAKDAAATVADAMGLVQERSTVHASIRQKQARSRAAAALRVAAQRGGDGQLAMLATTVELDSFEKVKKAIQAMIEMLSTQQDDEVKKSDWCKGEFKDNEMTTLKTDDRKADLEAKIAETESEIKKLQEAIAETGKRISLAMTSLQAAGLERKAQNLEFQKTVADMTLTMDVLKKALVRLQKFYGEESLAQVKQHRDDPSVDPVKQMEYKPAGGAAGVMQMLEKLMEESASLLVETKESEQDAQVAYEAAIESSNGAISAMQKEMVTKSKTKAKKEKAKLQAESDLASTSEELEGLTKYLADLHDECDFLLKNFDTRQGSRGAEIEALQQASQILSGASLG